MASGKNFCSIGPSILGADFSNLSSEIDSCIESGAGHLHLDVMDGHFVPNISFGMPIVQAIHRKYPNSYLDVHMMVENPEKWLHEMVKSGANCYTFHAESLNNDFEECKQLIEMIGKTSQSCHAGISLKPTSEEIVIDLLKAKVNLKQVLIMTVEPGFGGQSFMENQLEKISKIRKFADENGYKDLVIQADGGVKPGETARLAAQAGCNWLVSGSGVLKAKCRKTAIDEMLGDLEKVHKERLIKG